MFGCTDDSVVNFIRAQVAWPHPFMNNMSPRKLPGIDKLLNANALAPLVAQHGPALVKLELRSLQGELRASGDIPDWAATAEGYATRLREALADHGYRRVHNLTGTIIHTNLGRAPLSGELWDEIKPLVTGAMNLEYDLTRGARGDREKGVEDRLTRLTGAEAATVVNNNAAALLLVLNTFALNKSVPVSRGELIEIGGSFRLPDIMQRAGCALVEVGTTNRTHPRDFAAVAAHSAMLLKVHTSNYHIEGFTAEVRTRELAALANEHDVPLCVDIGSGTLLDLRKLGLPPEPTPSQVLDAGAHLVTFSGDKLLGGVQAGLIVGKAALIAELKGNPLKRALRADKISLAMLNATLKIYEDPDRAVLRIPLLRMLTTPLDVLEQRARQLRDLLAPRLPGYALEVMHSDAQIGSGAVPDKTLASRAVVIRHARPQAVRELEQRLRRLPQPAIGRIQQDALWLDLRAAADFHELLAAVECL